MNSLHKYAVHLRARAVQPMNKHFFFLILLPASLPPAKATLQVITTITVTQPGPCFVADENAVEEMDASLQERWLYNLRLLKRGYGVGNHRTRKKTWMLTAGPDRIGSANSESRTWPAPDGRRDEERMVTTTSARRNARGGVHSGPRPCPQAPWAFGPGASAPKLISLVIVPR